MNLFKKYFPVIITGLILALFFIFSQKIPNEEISKIIKSAGFFGPLIYIFINLLTYIIAPISGSPVSFAGFYIYGPNVVFLNLISAIIGSIINFYIARIGGRPLIIKFAGKSSLEKIDELSKNYGLKALFILRIFQGNLHDFISYAAGLTNLKFKKYFFVSTAGMIPGTFLIFFLAKNITNPLYYIIQNSIIAIVFTAIFIFGKKLKSSASSH